MSRFRRIGKMKRGNAVLIDVGESEGASVTCIDRPSVLHKRRVSVIYMTRGQVRNRWMTG